MSFSISYIFSLVDKFTPGAAAITAAATGMRGAIAAAGAAMGPLIARMAAVAAGVGLLAAAFVLGGVKQAAAFEESLTSLRRVTNISREDMLAYGEDALKVGVRTGKTGEEIASMMTEGALMGIRGRKTLAAFAETVAKVSVTWDDMGEKMASRSLSTLTSQWFSDLAPEDAARRLNETADAINELSNRSAFKAPELLKAFERGGVAAKKFGLSPEQFSAYAGTSLVVGEKSGELQGTRARMTFTKLTRNLAAPTKGFSGALKLLKMSREQMGQQLLNSPQDLMLNIMERMQGLDKIQQESVASGLLDAKSSAQFGAVAANLNEYKKQLAIVDDSYAAKFAKDDGFMSWLRNGGEGLKDIANQLDRYNKISTRSGSVNREFGNRTESLNFALKQFGASWDRFRILLAMPLLEPLRRVTNGLSDFTNALGDIAERSPAVGTMMTGGLMAGMTAMGAAVAAAGAKMLGFTGAYTALAALASTAGILSIGIAVTVVGIAAMYWIYDNWSRLKELAADPLKFKVIFPDAPEVLKNLPDAVALAMSKTKEVLMDSPMGPALGAVGSALNGPVGQTLNWLALGPPPDWMLPYTAADRFSFGAGMGGANMPYMPPATAPAPNPDRIPQAAAERVQIESTIRGEIAPLQVTATPITVHVTGQVNGPVTGTGSGSLSTNAPRGVSTSEAGSTSVSP